MKKCIFLSFIFISTSQQGLKHAEWGFFAHPLINEFAVYSLPDPLRLFYKLHLSEIKEWSTLPDKRRYMVEKEGPRHFIDLDQYDSALIFPFPIPLHEYLQHPQNDFEHHGILPWNLEIYKYRLIEAFKSKKPEVITKISAEIGHYIADAHVPLHTTSNYNGQFTNQVGIHGLWESRLIELYFPSFEFSFRKAEYFPNIEERLWTDILFAHSLLPKVFIEEINTTFEIGHTNKFSFEKRGNSTTRTYSKAFCDRYYAKLENMIENQFNQSVFMIASFWYSCWIEAGMPSLQRENIPLKRKHFKQLLRN